jgi:hypothetical protein
MLVWNAICSTTGAGGNTSTRRITNMTCKHKTNRHVEHPSPMPEEDPLEASPQDGDLSNTNILPSFIGETQDSQETLDRSELGFDNVPGSSHMDIHDGFVKVYSQLPNLSSLIHVQN